MSMEEKMILCPCCGRRLLIHITDDGIAVREAEPDLSQSDIQKIASELGIEVGAGGKGGE